MPSTTATAASPGAATSYQSNPFQLLRPAWEGFKLNARPYLALVGLAIGLAAAVIAVVALLAFIMHNPRVGLVPAVLGLLACLYLGITRLMPATVRLQLAMARQHRLTLREALGGDPRVGWRLLGVGILTGLAVLGGLILLIVPGIIIATWFSLAIYPVIDEDLGVIAAMKRSRQLARNRFWDVLGTNCLYQAMGIFYAIPLGGLLVIALSLIFAPLIALRYDQLVHLKRTSDGTGMPTSQANALAIILAFIAMFVSSSHAVERQAHQMYPLPVEKSRGPY